MNSRFRQILVIIAIILVDQVSKVLMTKWLLSLPAATFYLFPLCSLTLVYNYGISFGLFGSGTFHPYVFVVVSAGIALLLWRWANNWRNSTLFAALLVIGGALGNIIDRLRYGCVIDFIDLHWQQYHYPVFNVADICIVLGCCYLALQEVKNNSMAHRPQDTSVTDVKQL